MTSGRYRRLEELFARARALSADECEQFLNEACGEDTVLRVEVEALLQQDRSTGHLLDSPVLDAWDGAVDIPATVGPYRILHRIGEGGFAEVFAAEQTEPVRRRVALKLLKPGMDSRAILARFEGERQMLARMDHPHVARILDAGETMYGRPYFVMEEVVGKTITAHCDSQGLSVRARVQLFIQVCRAVQHAHQKGVLHRDLKPSNVLVTEVDGRAVPRVIDFGIAKVMGGDLPGMTLHTLEGQLLGTPEYMSPEQTGADVDTRADVYSLGVLLYELLTGVLPFDSRRLRASGPAEIERILREEEPARPSARIGVDRELAVRRGTDPRGLRRALRGDLDWIVLRALEKDPDRRYPTAHELAEDLERHLRDEPVVAGPPSTTYRLRKLARRNRVAIGVAAAIGFGLVAAAAGLTVALVQSNREQARTAAALAEAEAVTDFLRGMLRAADPRHQGRDVLMRTLLDERSAAIDREFADRPSVAFKLHNTVGVTYNQLGEHDRAVFHLARALELAEGTLPSGHVDTYISMGELGFARFGQGRYEEAEPLYRQALAGLERTVGPDHERTLTVLNVLASWHQHQGQFAAAESLWARSLEGRRRVLGPAHRLTLKTQSSLGSLYVEQGRHDEAEELLRAVHRLDPEGDAGEVALSNLGALYIQQGRYAEAEPLVAKRLEAVRGRLGDDHARTHLALNNLAYARMKLGQYADAEPLFLEALEGQLRRRGEDHIMSIQIGGNVGELYLHWGRAEQAERYLVEAVAAARRSLPAEHWLIGQSLRKLGQCWTQMGRFTDAEPVLLQGVEILSARFGSDGNRTRDAVAALVQLYERWGRDDEAAAWREQTLTP